MSLATRRRARPVQRFALLALLLVAACKPDAESERRSRAERALDETVQRDPELRDELGQSLVALARVQALGYVKDGPLLRGKLEARGKQSFLLVLKYGHCYRLLGVGDPDVSDLDLLLYDGNGVEVQRDVTQDPTPVLGVNASICPADATALRLEVRMRRGHGAFAIGQFRNLD